MINKLLSIFILTTFCFNFYSELLDISSERNTGIEYSSSVDKTTSVTTNQANIINECHDNDCHQTDDHCVHHCSGIHNLITNSENISLKINILETKKNNWNYKNLYLSLFIEPSLRPPLFS